ncbi:MAG: site-2 protease family protein, partial [Bdellovibrionales bacterium]
KMRGDNTAERLGRLSLNPVVHGDPIGTWVLPLSAIIFHTGFMFGWAKPVPVDSRNLKHPLKDMFWIALAGPASNIFLAVVSTFVLAVIATHGPAGSTGHALATLLINFIFVNITLAIFNLIPIHPLDGGKVIAPFLPIRWNMWLDHHQMQLSMMLFLLILTVGWILAVPVNFISHGLLDFAQLLAEKIA